jgi:hypothetical protein
MLAASFSSASIAPHRRNESSADFLLRDHRVLSIDHSIVRLLSRMLRSYLGFMFVNNAGARVSLILESGINAASTCQRVRLGSHGDKSMWISPQLVSMICFKISSNLNLRNALMEYLQIQARKSDETMYDLMILFHGLTIRNWKLW